MKKILFINGHLNAGGVERSLIDALQHLDYSKYEVDLLLLQGKGDYSNEIPSEVIVHAYDTTEAYGPFCTTIFKNFFHRNWFLLSYRIITQFLGLSHLSWIIPTLRKQYDSAIAYRCGICTDLLVETVKSKKKISWWHHGEMNLNKADQKHLYLNYQKIQHIVAVSDSSAALISQYFPLIKEKISIISNMLCPETIIRKASENSKYTFLSGSGKLNLLSVGRLSPEKNMRFCISVAKLLKEKSIPIEWILVGNGEEYEILREEIFKSDLTDTMRMTGTLSNPYPLMNSADLLFHPSLVESQGLTILEAMALGTPVISVESAGPKEFIKNDVNGIIVKNDVNEACEAIIRIYNNKNLRQSISKEGQITLNAFKPDIIIQKIEKLL